MDAMVTRGLALGELVAAVGGRLLSVAVASAGARVDDVVVAESAPSTWGQSGDLVLGIGVDTREAAVALVAAAAEHGAVPVLRRAVARRREVRTAARRAGGGLLELSDHASWAHLLWLVRGILDRTAEAAGLPVEGPVHDELMALADGCAALLGGPVTIEDPQSRVLAYSARQETADRTRVSTIIGRRVPDEVLAGLRSRGVFRRLARETEPFFLPPAADGSMGARLVVPVRIGREWLGSIWAVVDGPPATALWRPLQQTAAVVALHLLRLRSEADLARRLAADQLRTVLTGGGGADAIDGWTTGPWRVVALLGASADLWEAGLRRSGWRRPLLTTVDDEPCVVVDVAGGRGEPGSWAWLQAAVPGLALDPTAVRVGAGSAVSHPADLPRSRSEASEVARAVTAGVATLEELWAEVTLARAAAGVRSAGAIGPLATGGTLSPELRRTLAAWLDHPGDPRAAAGALHVHPNTVRYRLRQLTEHLGEDTLADPAARLALRLQLRVEGY